MNTDENQTSPEKDAELHAIQDFVWLYHNAQLAPEEAAKVEQLIATDPRAAKSYRACKDVEAHLATDAGKAMAAKEKSQIMEMLADRPYVQTTTPAVHEQSPANIIHPDFSIQIEAEQQGHQPVAPRRSAEFSRNGYQAKYALQCAAGGSHMTAQDFINKEGYVIDTPSGSVQLVVAIRTLGQSHKAIFRIVEAEAFAPCVISWERRDAAGWEVAPTEMLEFTQQGDRIDKSFVPHESDELWKFACQPA